MPTTSFDTAHIFTARWEGGLSEHAADPGGVTNHGVSLRWLLQLSKENEDVAAYDFYPDGTLDASDIRACTKAQAAALMRRNFWEPLRCAELSPPLAVTLYDYAVNAGAARAVRLLQAACNMVGEACLERFIPLKEDGRCGAHTVRRCAELTEAGLSFYTARHCVRERRRFYGELTRRRADLQPFLKGWNNRCAALLNYLGKLEMEA